MPLFIATVLSLLAVQPPLTAVAFSLDGSQVLVGSQTGIALRSWPDLQPKGSVDTKLAHIHDLSFSPSGKQLAIAGGSPGESGAVEIWDWPAAKLERTISSGSDLVYRAAWNADGSRLALACADKRLRLQSAAGSPPQVCEVHSAAVLAALWLPDDKFILSAGVDQAIRVLGSTSGKPIRTLDNHTAAVRDLALRPGPAEGLPLVVSVGADRTVRFWQPTIGRLVRFVRLPSPPTAAAWTPSGSHALVACEDGHLRAVDPESLAVVELAPHLAGWAHAVAVSPDGRFAVLAGEGGELRKIALDAINR